MARYYAIKIAVQLPFLILLAGAIVHLRKRATRTAVAQCTGAGIVCLHVVVNWVLFDMNLGVYGGHGPAGLPRWIRPYVRWQSMILATGFLLFSCAYLWEQIRADTAED